MPLTGLPRSQLSSWGFDLQIKLDVACPIHLSHFARVLCLPTLPLMRKIQDFPPSSNVPGKPRGTFISWIFLGLVWGIFAISPVRLSALALWRATVPIRGEDISPWSHASGDPFHKHKTSISQSYLFLTQNPVLGSKWWPVSTAPPPGDFPPVTGVCTAWLTGALVFWGGRSLESDHCLIPL